MGRRSRQSYALAKKQKGGNRSEDRISQLPQDILVYILSLLTIEQAARTSVLSKMWRCIWTHIENLNFDASKICEGLITRTKSLNVERCKYVHWVNQVVRSHKGPTIDEFRVKFALNKNHRYQIDSWVNFAMRKRVKKFELALPALSSYWGGLRTRPKKAAKKYTFPEMWYTAKCLRSSRPLGFSSCNSLTVLKLKHLDVKGEVLEYIFLNCPVLEHLCVKCSDSLVNLKVVGPSLRLKYLSISYCLNMKSLEISAKNLVSFRYIGPELSLPFKYTPCLAEIYVGGKYSHYLINNNLVHFSSYFSGLETLVLDLESYEGSIHSLEFPTLNNLNILKLIVSAHDDDSLLGFASLFEACPLLYKFTLELHDSYGEPIFPSEGERAPMICSHQHIKVVEFVGFVGRKVDVELAMYFIEKAAMLEKIILDTRYPRVIGTPWEDDEWREKQPARKRAHRLSDKLLNSHPGVSITVL